MRKMATTLLVVLSCTTLFMSSIACSKEEEETTEGIAETVIRKPLDKARALKEQAEKRAEDAAEDADEILKVETDEVPAKTEEKVSQGEEIVIAASTKGDPAKGKEKFDMICASCHGVQGHGDGPAAAALDPKPRNLGDASYVSTLSDEQIFKTVKEGGAAVGKSPLMPAWGGALTDDDIWNVIAYLRQSICKCAYKGK